MFFMWDNGNIEHIAKHGIEPHEAEYVIRRAKRPYPRRASSVKWMVRGRTQDGRAIQVVYVIRDPSEIDIRLLMPSEQIALQQGEAAAYVIHARPLRRREA